MKLTKHAQSCFLIETDGKRILIDPGKFCYDGQIENMKPEDWKNIDVLLLTHKHHDHCLPESVKIIQKNNPKSRVYCNKEVAAMMKKEKIKCKIVKVGDKLKEGKIRIDVVKAVHGYHTGMKDTGFPKDNNGYLIKSGGKSVYHTSDTIGFYADMKPDIILLPICGNSVVFEPLAAVEFAQELDAKLIIPMHYDAPIHPTGTEKFEEEIKKTDLNYKILKIGETIEV